MCGFAGLIPPFTVKVLPDDTMRDLTAFIVCPPCISGTRLHRAPERPIIWSYEFGASNMNALK